MTDNTSEDISKVAPKAKNQPNSKMSNPKYPAMEFVVNFSKLMAMIMAVLFLGFALLSIITGIFNEDRSFLWGLVNAGFYIMAGGVLIGLVKGMGEAFELLLDLEKRK